MCSRVKLTNLILGPPSHERLTVRGRACRPSVQLRASGRHRAERGDRWADAAVQVGDSCRRDGGCSGRVLARLRGLPWCRRDRDESGSDVAGSGGRSGGLPAVTGRMPLPSPDAESLRRAPEYDPATIDALVAYVAAARPRRPGHPHRRRLRRGRLRRWGDLPSPVRGLPPVGRRRRGTPGRQRSVAAFGDADADR